MHSICISEDCRGWSFCYEGTVILDFGLLCVFQLFLRSLFSLGMLGLGWLGERADGGSYIKMLCFFHVWPQQASSVQFSDCTVVSAQPHIFSLDDFHAVPFDLEDSQLQTLRVNWALLPLSNQSPPYHWLPSTLCWNSHSGKPASSLMDGVWLENWSLSSYRYCQRPPVCVTCLF